MAPVGQARIARSATRRSAPATGWAFTKDVPGASPNTAGAIWRQVSQSMQVESTKKSPGTFSGTRFFGFATDGPPFTEFYPGTGSASRVAPAGKMDGANCGPGVGPGIRSGDRHGAEDQGVLGLRLTVLLPSGVSATGSRPGEGCRGRVDAVRASARTARDAAARRGLPPAGVAAKGLPHRPTDGRADQTTH